MFCNYCGKPNPDDGLFCSFCGRELAQNVEPQLEQPSVPQAEKKPEPQNAQNTAPQTTQSTASSTNEKAPVTTQTETKYTLADFYKRFRVAWREFVTSPLALVLITLQSLCALVTVFQVSTLFAEAEALLSLVGAFDSEVAEGSFFLSLAQIALCAPGILISIGMWILYADAVSRSDRQINDTGLGVIYWTNIGNAVLSGIGILYTCIKVFDAKHALMESVDNRHPDYTVTYSSALREAESQLNGILIGLLIGAIVGVLLLWIILKLINTVRETARQCEPSAEYVKAVAVIEFVVGSLGLVLAFSTEITVAALLSSALQFMFGIVLLKYKAFMEKQSQEKFLIKHRKLVKK